jgi:hypothetical protein
VASLHAQKIDLAGFVYILITDYFVEGMCEREEHAWNHECIRGIKNRQGCHPYIYILVCNPHGVAGYSNKMCKNIIEHST